jgi:hypothetical protein
MTGIAVHNPPSVVEIRLSISGNVTLETMALPEHPVRHAFNCDPGSSRWLTCLRGISSNSEPAIILNVCKVDVTRARCKLHHPNSCAWPQNYDFQSSNSPYSIRTRPLRARRQFVPRSVLVWTIRPADLKSPIALPQPQNKNGYLCR